MGNLLSCWVSGCIPRENDSSGVVGSCCLLFSTHSLSCRQCTFNFPSGNHCFPLGVSHGVYIELTSPPAPGLDSDSQHLPSFSTTSLVQGWRPVRLKPQGHFADNAGWDQSLGNRVQKGMCWGWEIGEFRPWLKSLILDEAFPKVDVPLDPSVTGPNK